MRRKKDIDFKYKLIGGLFISLMIIILLGQSLNNNKKLNFFEVTLRDTSLFMVRILNAPIVYLKDLNTNYEKYIVDVNTPAYKRIAAENKSLKSSLQALRKERTINYVDNYTPVIGEVVIRNINTWYHQLTIDMGKKDGLKVGDAVVSNGGLVGTINQLSNHYATVDLLFNNRTSLIVPATVLNASANELGYIKGYDPFNQVLIFNKINNDVNVKVDDQVVTSSLGGKLPIGILIGKVSSIERDEYGIVDKLKIKPAANFNRLRYVTVLTKGNS